MNGMYEAFRDEISWAVQLSKPKIPGVHNRAAAVTIIGRRHERLEEIGGDNVSDVQFDMLPENQPNPGDTLDDAEVMKVASVKDGAGNVQWWVAYGRK